MVDCMFDALSCVRRALTVSWCEMAGYAMAAVDSSCIEMSLREGCSVMSMRLVPFYGWDVQFGGRRGCETLLTLRSSHFSSLVTCLISVGDSLIVRNSVSRAGIVRAAAVDAVSAVARVENFILKISRRNLHKEENRRRRSGIYIPSPRAMHRLRHLAPSQRICVPRTPHGHHLDTLALVQLGKSQPLFYFTPAHCSGYA